MTHSVISRIILCDLKSYNFCVTNKDKDNIFQRSLFVFAALLGAALSAPQVQEVQDPVVTEQDEILTFVDHDEADIREEQQFVPEGYEVIDVVYVPIATQGEEEDEDVYVQEDNEIIDFGEG